jgi:hypothetical protein
MNNKIAKSIICPKSSFNPLGPISHLIGKILEMIENNGLRLPSK